ncbi:hypothetical protein A2U01_0078230 [Trifolium medium]|uniref:Uncharacterized protein n=1 Tax=Trifolium medium TaxID=97028 RepID=A0A392T7H6_9FABA|nr:hypothetical protein [Trifolium medium]
MDPDQGNDPPSPGRGRGRLSGRPRVIPHGVVRNRFLAGMPKFRNVDGVEEAYNSYDDDDDHEDEEIDESLLLYP